MEVASKWLKDCHEDHKGCGPFKDVQMQLPTRVLDVGLSVVGKCAVTCLVDGKKRQDSYVALSYCWGGERLLILDQNTRERLHTGLTDNEFPPTLRDAIAITRNLGIRYLWIDALCIYQDSEDDWAAESAKMRDVYSAATITLAAAAATKVSDGIFRKRPLPPETCRLMWRNEALSAEYIWLRPAMEVLDREMRVSFINTRGWTLQESLLSYRVLWFCKTQLVFECAEGRVNEAGHHTQATDAFRNKDLMNQLRPRAALARLYQVLRLFGIPPIVRVPWLVWNPPWDRAYTTQISWLVLDHCDIYTQGMLTTQSGKLHTPYEHWCAIVKEYTNRSLTKETDALPALSGLAEHFAKATGDRYIAGVWESCLVDSLGWTRASRPHQRPGNENFVQPHSDRLYVAPSWSWASVQGSPVTLPNDTRWAGRLAKIISVAVERATSDLYGKLEGGRLVMDAPFLPIPDPQIPLAAGTLYPSLQRHLYERITTTVTPGDDMANNFRQSHVECDEQVFALVQTCRSGSTMYILLLESTGNSVDYRRVACWPQKMHPGPNLIIRTRLGEGVAAELEQAPWSRRRITLV